MLRPWHGGALANCCLRALESKLLGIGCDVLIAGLGEPAQPGSLCHMSLLWGRLGSAGCPLGSLEGDCVGAAGSRRSGNTATNVASECGGAVAGGGSCRWCLSNQQAESCMHAANLAGCFRMDLGGAWHRRGMLRGTALRAAQYSAKQLGSPPVQLLQVMLPLCLSYLGLSVEPQAPRHLNSTADASPGHFTVLIQHAININASRRSAAGGLPAAIPAPLACWMHSRCHCQHFAQRADAAAPPVVAHAPCHPLRTAPPFPARYPAPCPRVGPASISVR